MSSFVAKTDQDVTSAAQAGRQAHMQHGDRKAFHPAAASFVDGAVGGDSPLPVMLKTSPGMSDRDDL